MAKLNITQVRSRIGSTKLQKKNLDALGLRRMNRTVTHEDSAVIRGMITKVHHLVVVTEAKEETKAKAKAAPAAEAKATEAPVAAEPATDKKPVARKPAAAKKPAAKKDVEPATTKKDE